MKRFLLLLIILTTKICEGQLPNTGSSTGTGFSYPKLDTLCFPTHIIRKVLIAAEQKKVCDSLLTIREKQVAELNNHIELLNEKDTATVGNYNRQIANLNEQIALYKDQIKGYEKLVRKERFRRRLITGAGILTTGIIAYLYLKK